MSSFTRLMVVLSCVSTAFGGSGGASCPAPSLPSSNPKWIWQSLEYTSSNSDITTAMSSVASAWSGAGGISISASYTYNDIQMSSATLPSGTVGTTTDFSQASSGCYLYQDGNGRCMDRSVMYYVTVVVDTAQISTDATAQSLNYANYVKSVVAHEIGHVLGLSENGILTSPVTCGTDTFSIMEIGGNGRTYCGLLLPTSCDTDGVDDTYYNWPVGDYYACTETHC